MEHSRSHCSFHLLSEMLMKLLPRSNSLTLEVSKLRELKHRLRS